MRLINNIKKYIRSINNSKNKLNNKINGQKQSLANIPLSMVTFNGSQCNCNTIAINHKKTKGSD